MRSPPPPLRFLMLVGATWIAVRAFTLAPFGPENGAVLPVASGPMRPAATTIAAANPDDLPPGRPMAEIAADRAEPTALTLSRLSAPSLQAPTPITAFAAHNPAIPTQTTPFHAPRILPTPNPFARSEPPPASSPRPVLGPVAAGSSRWGGSAWLFVRDEGGGTLAPGGTLGGGQAGMRLTYRLNADARRPLSLSARLYAPLANTRGAEAAIGLDWRPFATLPVNLLVERRQRLGRDGRSDFALIAHGGGEASIAGGRVRVAGYAQAGIVGVEARDLFADGAVVATTRVGPLDLGAGAWGGAQPGVARLDVGPHAGFRLPVGRTTIRVSGEWRFRIAGDAAPDSGPALTITAGF